jgi:hypothetical protein
MKKRHSPCLSLPIQMMVLFLACSCTRAKPLDFKYHSIQGRFGSLTRETRVDHVQILHGPDLYIWSDILEPNGNNSNTLSSKSGSRWSGQRSSDDGRHFAWDYHVTGKNSGMVTIDHVKYTIKAGTIILVTQHDGKPVIDVHEVTERLGVYGFRATIDAWANDIEVREFYSD